MESNNVVAIALNRIRQNSDFHMRDTVGCDMQNVWSILSAKPRSRAERVL